MKLEQQYYLRYDTGSERFYLSEGNIYKVMYKHESPYGKGVKEIKGRLEQITRELTTSRNYNDPNYYKTASCLVLDASKECQQSLITIDVEDVIHITEID